jgi:hypothetical protein
VKNLSGSPLYVRLLALLANTTTRLERLARNKNLFRKSVNYGRNMFYVTGPWTLEKKA